MGRTNVSDPIERRLIAERFVEHRRLRRSYVEMSRGEIMQREMDRLRNTPVVLTNMSSIDKEESAALLLLKGLEQRYFECLMADRLDIWARAAHSIVDFVSPSRTKVHKRRATR